MNTFRHAGGCLPIHATVKASLDPLINANWNNSSVVGYINGLSVL